MGRKSAARPWMWQRSQNIIRLTAQGKNKCGHSARYRILPKGTGGHWEEGKAIGGLTKCPEVGSRDSQLPTLTTPRKVTWGGGKCTGKGYI